MRNFLLHITYLLILMSIIYGIVFLTKPVNSISGEYLRVSSRKYFSLITGTSTAARGLSPVILQEILGEKYKFPMMNFSFTIGMPYGEVYLQKIKEKTIENPNKNSLFVLSVDPFSLGNYEIKEISNNIPREKNSVIDRLNSVSSQPNLEYFFKYIFFSKQFVTLEFNTDGGCDKYGFDASNLDIKTDPEWKRRERIDLQIMPWYEKEVIPSYQFSKNRLYYLTQTINFLKKNGEVFLVRMPVGKELVAQTNTVFPHFDDFMQNFANKNGISYISYWQSSSDYKTTDGVHLYKIEAEKLSRRLAKKIGNIN